MVLDDGGIYSDCTEALKLFNGISRENVLYIRCIDSPDIRIHTYNKGRKDDKEIMMEW